MRSFQIFFPNYISKNFNNNSFFKLIVNKINNNILIDNLKNFDYILKYKGNISEIEKIINIIYEKQKLV